MPNPFPAPSLAEQLADARNRVTLYRHAALVDGALGRRALADAAMALAEKWQNVVAQLERLLDTPAS